jgi:hypothetical protein
VAARDLAQDLPVYPREIRQREPRHPTPPGTCSTGRAGSGGGPPPRPCSGVRSSCRTWVTGCRPGSPARTGSG